MYLLKNNFTGQEQKASSTKALETMILKNSGISIESSYDKKKFLSILKDTGRVKIGLGKLSIVVLNLRLRNEDGTLKSLKGEKVLPIGKPKPKKSAGRKISKK